MFEIDHHRTLGIIESLKHEGATEEGDAIAAAERIFRQSRKSRTVERTFERKVFWYVDIPVGGGMHARLAEAYIPVFVQKAYFGIRDRIDALLG